MGHEDVDVAVGEFLRAWVGYGGVGVERTEEGEDVCAQREVERGRHARGEEGMWRGGKGSAAHVAVRIQVVWSCEGEALKMRDYGAWAIVDEEAQPITEVSQSVEGAAVLAQFGKKKGAVRPAPLRKFGTVIVKRCRFCPTYLFHWLSWIAQIQQLSHPLHHSDVCSALQHLTHPDRPHGHA